jgi:hypothetical protein
MLGTRHWDASHELLVTAISNTIGPMTPRAVVRSDGHGRMIRSPFLRKNLGRDLAKEHQSSWSTQSHYEPCMLIDGISKMLRGMSRPGGV